MTTYQHFVSSGEHPLRATFSPLAAHHLHWAGEVAGGAVERQGNGTGTFLHQPGIQLPHPLSLPAGPQAPHPPAAPLPRVLLPPADQVPLTGPHQLAGPRLDSPHQRHHPRGGDQAGRRTAARNLMGRPTACSCSTGGGGGI